MVVTRERGETTPTVRGPETAASTSPIPQEAEFFAIRFRLGSFIPSVSMERLVDGALTLPGAGDDAFWLT